jgi:hypothetical protein
MTDTQTIAPTPERIAHAMGLMDAPEVTQSREIRAYKQASLVARLHKAGKLSDECLKAFERFDDDWHVGNAVPSGVGGYGERIAGASPDGGEHAEVRKLLAKRRADEAEASIGSPSARRALRMIVGPRRDDPTCTLRPYTVEDIGRMACGMHNRVQAIAAGTTTLRDMLWQLHLHYDEG